MTSHKKKSSTSIRLAAALLAGSALAGVPLVAYADSGWVGGTSTDWYTASNWLPAAIPTAADDTTIDVSAPNATIVNGGTAATNMLRIGVDNVGSLTLNTNAAFTAHGTSVLGFNAGSSGALTVEGNSVLTLVGAGSGLDVGNSGSGQVLVQTGGSIILSSGGADLLIGEQVGGSGAMVIDGNGSSVLAADWIVGAGGRASLTVQNGAAAISTGNMTLGYLSNYANLGSDTVLVTGAGSSLTAGSLDIGQIGTASMTVQNGATAEVANDLFVGGALSLGSHIANGTLAIASGGVMKADSNTEIGLDVAINGDANVGAVTVDGTGSALTTVTTLYIGDAGGVGSVSVTNGGLVQTGINVELGNTLGSTGTLTVDDAGSSVVDGVEVDVGLAGTGSLTVQNGGTMSAIGLTAGLNSESNGTITITGSSSSVTLSDGVVVGDAGTGVLSILNSATFDSPVVVIGATGRGTATVDGDAGLTSSFSLSVGDQSGGVGALTISNGGTVTETGFTTIGNLAGSTGTVTITDIGSTLTSQGPFTVADAGTANLSVLNLATLTTQSAVVGAQAGASGTVLLDGFAGGQHSNWTVGQNLVIGRDAGATGLTTLSNGGEVIVTGTTELGVAAGSSGTMTVTGFPSFFLSGADVHIGEGGSGTLNILAGGTVETVADTDVGQASGATGIVTIDGAGSTWNATGNVNVGGDGVSATGGTGTVNVTGGGSLNATDVNLGNAAGATGTLLVDGTNSVVTSTDLVGVGVVGSGTGALTVQSGGVINSDVLAVGYQPGSQGAAVITGAGSSVVLSDTLSVGLEGTGSLSLLAGATISDAAGVVGLEPGANGTITVDGAHSRWTNSSGIVVGGEATGLLNITNGGEVDSTGLAAIGLGGGSAGTVMVDGAGSFLSVNTNLALGGYNTGLATGGTGILNVTGGGSVQANDILLGEVVGGVGFLTVDGANSVVNATNALTVGDANGASGTVTVRNGGTLSAASVIIASQAGSIGEIDIGAAPGSVAVAPGTLDASTLTFGAGTGTLNFNHTGTAYAFAPAISGAGTINQMAGTTFLAADDSAFTGPTNITGGALHVNGSLRSSAVTVSGGGTLAGNGTVGSVAALSGGIVAPGNSIGTLNVNGNYNAASGSVYQVQVDSAGHSDLLLVSGTANIANGAVLDIAKTDSGGYVAGKYTLLTAAGGVNGSYILTGDVTQNAFSSEALAYDANDVYLDVTKVASFASAGATPNQQATGGGADGLPTTSPLYGALLGLPSFVAAQGAFDQISGEIHASAHTALVEDSRFVREAALDRLQTANTGRPVVWGQGFGDWGSNDGNGNAAGMNRSTKGFIGGVDVPVYQTWRVGVLGGFSDTDLNVKDRSSAGTSTNYHLGLYGGTETGPIPVRLGAAYSWHDLQTTRAVAFSGFSDQLTAQYNGGTTQAFGEVGYKLDVDAVSLEPFANLTYVNLNMGAFKEIGGSSALSVASATTDTTFTTLGVHAKEQVDLGTSAVITAKASLGWRHAFGDVTSVSNNAFAGGTAFNIDGIPIAQDAAAIDAGFDAAVSEHLTLSLSYTGQYATGARDNGVKANVGWKF